MMIGSRTIPRWINEWSLGALIVAVATVSLLLGAYHLPLPELIDALAGRGTATENYLIWHVRLPRVILAGLVGAGLASTGAAVQGLFRNPLAEPTFIGITSGAMLFAVAAMILGHHLADHLPLFVQQFGVSIAAFFGALLTTVLVYRIATRRGRLNVTTMLLAGIAISALAGAGSGLMIYGSDESQLRDITFWTMGSISGAAWIPVAICAPVTAAGLYYLQRDALALNSFLLGEREAAQLGFDVKAVKRRIIVWTALIVGVGISLTGLIGFVGLIVPHLLRLVVGTDYRRLLLYSALLGAAFLLSVDSLARTIISPAELPIGILTAVFGAPFFIWLLLRNRDKQASL